MIRFFLIAALLGCSTAPEIIERSPCPALTHELVAYVSQAAEEFFGDRDFETPIVVDRGMKVPGSWAADAIYINCDSVETMCSACSHEIGHAEAFVRYGDPDALHVRFKVWWDSWSSWACGPAVMKERGYEGR